MRNRLLAWLVIVFAAAALAFGGLWLQERARSRAYRDQDIARSAIDQLGPTFGEVRVVVSTHIRANVLGRVESDADLARLYGALDETDPTLRDRLHVAVKVKPAVAAEDAAKPDAK